MFEELERYKTLDFFARQVVEGFITGRHKSPFHGFSVEFAEHRLYNTGEPTRNIDWKLYARTDKLFVKRFEEETNLRCHILIDQSSSMCYPVERHADLRSPNKLTFSVYAAAAIIELLARQRDAFGLTLFSDGIDLQSEVRSNSGHQRHLYSLLEQLLRPLDPEKMAKKTTSIADTIHLMAEKMHRRSLVVLFTDAFVDPSQHEALFDSLRHLRHCKHEVILFHTFLRDKEINFDFGNKPCYFVDLETDRKVKLYPQAVAEAYRQQMLQATASIKQHAIQYKVDYVPVDVGLGFDQVLQPYLLKRSKHG